MEPLLWHLDEYMSQPQLLYVPDLFGKGLSATKAERLLTVLQGTLHVRVQRSNERPKRIHTPCCRVLLHQLH